MDEKRLIEEIVEEVKARLQTGQEAVLIGRLAANERTLLEKEFKLVSLEEMSSAEVVILAETPVHLLAELALGIPVSEEGRAVLHCLMEGKKVCFFEEGMEYRRYRKTTAKPLYRLFQEYEDIICRFGVRKICHTTDIMSQCRETQDTCLDLTCRKLLRESDLIRARGQGYRSILLDRDTIFTPLASDYAQNHGILIVRKG